MQNQLKKFNAIDTSRLAKIIDYNVKNTDIEDKIPSIANLTITATSTYNAVKNKAPAVNKLVKKQIMMQKHQTLKKYILLLLIINNIRIIYLMQR